MTKPLTASRLSPHWLEKLSPGHRNLELENTGRESPGSHPAPFPPITVYIQYYFVLFQVYSTVVGQSYTLQSACLALQVPTWHQSSRLLTLLPMLHLTSLGLFRDCQSVLLHPLLSHPAPYPATISSVSTSLFCSFLFFELHHLQVESCGVCVSLISLSAMPSRLL